MYMRVEARAASALEQHLLHRREGLQLNIYRQHLDAPSSPLCSAARPCRRVRALTVAGRSFLTGARATTGESIFSESQRRPIEPPERDHKYHFEH